jgi:hypothetical protein
MVTRDAIMQTKGAKKIVDAESHATANPAAEQLDQDSVNNHQPPMRSVILVIALVLLDGCYTYKQSEFFRPDGPGATVRDFDSVPRVQEINLTSALTMQLRALRQDTTLQADLRLNIRYGHRARFQTPVLGFQCGGEAIQWIAIAPGTESGARDGVGFTSPHAADQEFPGAAYERRIPNRGVILYGNIGSWFGCPPATRVRFRFSCHRWT